MQACARRIAEGLRENEKTADFEAAVTRVVEDAHGRYLARHLEASDGELMDDKDYFLLSRTDLLGLEPLLDSYRGADWDDLQRMVGLNKVKSIVRSLFDGLLLNYHREIEGKAKLHFSLSRIFLGPPGIGKFKVDGRRPAAFDRTPANLHLQARPRSQRSMANCSPNLAISLQASWLSRMYRTSSLNTLATPSNSPRRT